MGTSPGRSLWSLIADHAEVAAMPGIHAALGPSLVDSYREAHAEAEMWRRIWCAGRPSGTHGSRVGTPGPRGALADPPVGKELLRAEVKMLLQSLGERAGRDGRDVEELLSRYKQETVNYALGHRDSCPSLRSPPDADNGSRPGSPCPAPSTAADQIVALRDKLSVTEIGQVVERLRSVFIEETKALIRLTDEIKGNIKKQRGQGESGRSEPSLADLRELREALQTDLELPRPSSAAFLPNKDLKKRLRSPSGQSIKTLTHTSISRPHLLSPLPHKPQPPSSPPPTKASPCRTSRLLRITSASRTSTETPDGTDASAPPARRHSVSKAETETLLLPGFPLTAPPTRVPN
ncbi:coiled-coil domain-containing protein 24 [Salarias fasciatus]|uniref:coiled-coil domain-containing protein 24 n=1 Tax=Salarias fasciatus TaxID=181472 RepID=UPI00117665BC|nr:uncharacterized protein LOC115406130 [Salarias fasciatus]